MSRLLIDKLDDLWHIDEEDELDLNERDILDLVDGKFTDGITVSAEEVHQIEAIWEKYCG
jgi:hypothetical protein